MSPQIKYNKEAKIISIRISKRKSVDSDVKNNVVIDYDKDGGVVNIDIMKIGLNEFKKIHQAAPFRDFVKIGA